MVRRLLLVLALVAFPLAPASVGEEPFQPLLEEYLERIDDQTDPADRAKLVERVARFGNRNAADLLIASIQNLSDKLDTLLENLNKLEAAHEDLNSNQDVGRDDFKTRTEIREKMMAHDGKIAAHRKVLVAIRKALAGFTAEPARDYVSIMAVKAPFWRQRGICAQVSAGYPSDNGRDGAVKALKDKEPRVVIHALLGLRDRKDPETLEAVVACLRLEVWVAQSIAAETLAQIGSLKAVRHLIDALGKTTGRVQDDINEALKTLTGMQLGPDDYQSWKDWYEEHKEEFEGEAGKPLARARKRKPEDDSSYYGIKTRSKRIVYVLDVSGSMNKELGTPGNGAATPKEGEEERFSGPKIEIAKKELKRAIRNLPDNAYFNIITFNHLVKTWKPKMVQAKQKTKNEAYIFIRQLRASGSTFTYGALKEAFKLAGMGARDPKYESGVNTMFLLSDGAPTDQTFPTSKLMDPQKVLDAVREWNSLSKIIIHAIAIDVATQGANFIRFMKQLATENGGKYIERG